MISKIFHVKSSDETFSLGESLAQSAKPGQVYCLDGDLGVGKTVFSKGFAKGLGIVDHITSPTFTIINVYEDGRLPFYHFDVYRVTDEYELDEIGYEEYFYGEGVTLIEWATLIPRLIPESAIHIIIEKDLEQGFDYRRITLKER